MGLFTWVEAKIHNMKWYDMSLTKICLILLGLIIGAYASGFVKQNIAVIAILTVLLYGVLMIRFFRL